MAKCLRKAVVANQDLGATRRVGRLPRSDVGTRSRALGPTDHERRCAGDLGRTGSKACNCDCLRANATEIANLRLRRGYRQGVAGSAIV